MEEDRLYITSIKTASDGNYDSLPAGTSWKDIQPFSVITGVNGVGKTHLLNWLLDVISNYSYPPKRRGRGSLEFNREPSFSEYDSISNSVKLITHDIRFESQISKRGKAEKSQGNGPGVFKIPEKDQLVSGVISLVCNDGEYEREEEDRRDNNYISNLAKCITQLLDESIKKRIKAKKEEYEKDLETRAWEKKEDKIMAQRWIRMIQAPREKEIGKTLITVTSELIEPYLPLIFKFEDISNEKELLDAWFKNYHQRRKTIILRAYEDLKETSPEAKILKITKTIKEKLGDPPWDRLNKVLATYRKKYNFKHSIKIPDSYVEEDVKCQFESIKEEGTSIVIDFDHLSSGEKMIIQTMLLTYNLEIFGFNYKFLLLDEPDSHFHPSLAQLFVETIQKELVENLGMQVIMVTHHPTTLALVPENSIFEMTRDKDNKVKIEHVYTTKAIESLTDNILIVTPQNHRLVFTEDRRDADFYQKNFEKAKLLNFVDSKVQLFFTSAAISTKGDKNRKTQLKSTGSGGCVAVREFVKRLRTNEEHNVLKDGKFLEDYAKRSPQRHFIYGLIDKDENNEDSPGIVVLKRREYENFQFDYVLLCMEFLDNIVSICKELKEKDEEGKLNIFQNFNSFLHNYKNRSVTDLKSIIEPLNGFLIKWMLTTIEENNIKRIDIAEFWQYILNFDKREFETSFKISLKNILNAKNNASEENKEVAENKDDGGGKKTASSGKGQGKGKEKKLNPVVQTIEALFFKLKERMLESTPIFYLSSEEEIIIDYPVYLIEYYGKRLREILGSFVNGFKVTVEALVKDLRGSKENDSFPQFSLTKLVEKAWENGNLFPRDLLDSFVRLQAEKNINQQSKKNPPFSNENAKTDPPSSNFSSRKIRFTNENIYQFGGEIKNAGGGGDCLFHAIAAAANMEDPDAYRLLRATAVQIIRDHQVQMTQILGENWFQDEIITAKASISPSDLATYTKYMEQEGTWGGLPEIRALAHYLKQPIYIFSSRKSTHSYISFCTNLVGEDMKKEPLLLFYVGNNHYQYIKLIRGNSTQDFLEAVYKYLESKDPVPKEIQFIYSLIKQLPANERISLRNVFSLDLEEPTLYVKRIRDFFTVWVNDGNKLHAHIIVRIFALDTDVPLITSPQLNQYTLEEAGLEHDQVKLRYGVEGLEKLSRLLSSKNQESRRVVSKISRNLSCDRDMFKFFRNDNEMAKKEVCKPFCVACTSSNII